MKLSLIEREERIKDLGLINREIEIAKDKLNQLYNQAYKLKYELGYYAKNEILYGVKYDEPS